jgi:DNA-binding transcriptional ArsR family regulator
MLEVQRDQAPTRYLTNIFVRFYPWVMTATDPAPPSPADVAILHSTHQAAAALDPVRLRILAHLRHPDSAAGTARALHAPRQRIGYHIRQLTQAGLLDPAGERRIGTSIEQLLQSSATHFFLGPQALGPIALDPAMAQDQLSSTYLIATAYRAMLDVSELQRRAHNAAKKLPTLTLETEISFESVQKQSEFAAELTAFMKTLSVRYNAINAPNARNFRVIAAAHPAPERPTASTL